MTIEVCIRHNHWWPCLGKHQRYDGEPCEVTSSPSAIQIIREFHGGMMSLAETKKALKKIRKTQEIDQRDQNNVES